MFKYIVTCRMPTVEPFRLSVIRLLSDCNKTMARPELRLVMNYDHDLHEIENRNTTSKLYRTTTKTGRNRSSISCLSSYILYDSYFLIYQHMGRNGSYISCVLLKYRYISTSYCFMAFRAMTSISSRRSLYSLTIAVALG